MNERIERRSVIQTVAAIGLAGLTDGCAPTESAGSKDERSAAAASRMPTLYIPHGGGPCFFMDWTMGPKDTWDRMAAWLRSIDQSLPVTPKALLVVSAHWEESEPTVLSAPAPEMLFDYYGFPEHTYQLSWPAPGTPDLARRVRSLLEQKGIPSGENASRGFDHGVFVPMLLAYPEAKIPTIQLSLKKGLDPAAHLAIGQALAPLRDEGVLIVGSGMSYHNMRGFSDPRSGTSAKRFDQWLTDACTDTPSARNEQLTRWTTAPDARNCHPREEHLLPLMVVSGAASEDRGVVAFRDEVMNVTVSAIRFG